jgi:DNA-binding CsgD family transcriptional regulator
MRRVHTAFSSARQYWCWSSARGLSNGEICQQLVISEATAKTRVARILQKLNLRDRIQAVIYAYENGLVTPRSGDAAHL